MYMYFIEQNTDEVKTDRTVRRNRKIHNYSQDSNTSLSIIDMANRQKICKSLEDLNNTINQFDPTDIYRISHPTTPAESTFFSNVHGEFIKMHHILGHHTSLNEL